MAPVFGEPNYDFLVDPIDSISQESDESKEYIPRPDQTSLTEMAFWYMIVLVVMLLTWLFVFFCLRIITLRQKTRNPQRRRAQGAQRGPSLPPQEPTIYVSPANLPPPPKYEALAPPSYEEVVGIHYPQYVTHPTHQPITVPITTALSQNYEVPPQTSTGNGTNADPAPTVITMTADERRTSVTVARS